MKSTIWVIDAGETAVSAVAAEAGPEGPRVLGAGEVPAEGMRHGEFIHVGDVSECLVAAVRQAERTSGLRCGAVFYNFDDAAMESRFSAGSTVLAGEGQVRTEDVRAASAMAERLVCHFEKNIVYSHETAFLIDGHDPVADPLGVFGRQLDVTQHILLARARHLEDWRRAIERARIGRGVAVLSLLSSARGVLTAEERQGRRILFDLGEDVLTGGVFERGVLREYAGCSAQGMTEAEITAWVRTAAKSFSTEGTDNDIVLTGDLAEKTAVGMREMPAAKARVAVPLMPFDQPRHAALAGLLRLAAETPRARTAHSQQEIISGLRRRAEALIHEYF